jgi:hypothetical protein
MTGPIRVGLWLMCDVIVYGAHDQPKQVEFDYMGRTIVLTGEQAVALRDVLVSTVDHLTQNGKKPKRPTWRARIVGVDWKVGTVAEGKARTVVQAQDAIARERRKAGKLRATITIHRADGGQERRTC